jgi:hypothetical protein
MKHSGSFTHDLSFGEESEDWVKELFGGNVKVEVKRDRLADATGNLYIEVYSRNKPSGISTTTASVWVFCLKDITLIITTEKLKNIVKEKYNGRLVKGGDHDSSRGVLIPIKELFK